MNSKIIFYNPADQPRAQGVAFLDGTDMDQAVEKFNSFKPVFRGEGECGQEAELMKLIQAYELPKPSLG